MEAGRWYTMVNALIAVLLLSGAAGCSRPNEESAVAAPFELLDAGLTGLTFTNDPQLTDALNVFNYMYFYNGGGLAAGDFDGDGSVDLFFTANRGANALYLNRGDMHFEDVTAASAVAGDTAAWTTGASVVDINQDGLLDIYVMQVSGVLGLPGHNLLYLNEGVDADGIPRFREAAAHYGLDQQGYGTMAVFFDYDGDGDLDCFQLNHSTHQNGTFGPRDRFDVSKRHALAGDRLLRNDGPPTAGGGGFTDVTEEAGIISTALGYGLGVALGDVNNDGLTDIYVGNDFHENDYLYLNQGDGTFREALTTMVAHTSRFTMGVDLADVNGDGLTDIFSLDMLPEDPVILKQSLAEDGFDVFKFKLGFGYNPQFSRNALQLNNGDGSFSEVAAQAGLHATDWSWAPLFLDFDDDGRSDLFISNGIPRRMNDIDWINFKTSDNRERAGTKNERSTVDELKDIDRMPQIKLPNKFFHAAEALRFDDRTDVVTGGRPSYSNSAVYADLDGDGDLDIVTNNIGDSPFVYRNLRSRDTLHSYLNFRFAGVPPNRNAIGASVIVWSGRERRRYERFPGRGFQASALTDLHIGIGDSSRVDSVTVVWPDGGYQTLHDLSFNTIVSVRYRKGLPVFDYGRLSTLRSDSVAVLRDVAAAHGVDYLHRENEFVDFNREPLIPHMLSTQGPALATGDLNGDGLEDFFVGSAKWERSGIYLQRPGGTFELMVTPELWQDSTFEDVSAVIADLDGDGIDDLMVAAGGNEYQARQEPRRQRSYLGDGNGHLRRNDVLTDVFMTASRVVADDFDGDGRTDLFLAGRAVPGRYGEVPESVLLKNEGGGSFADVTDVVAPGLRAAGLMTDAAWADVDQNGHPDLVVSLEWGAVTVWYNDGNRFAPRPVSPESGWWTRVLVTDVNLDGRPDIIAGNFGTNSKFQPNAAEPLRLHVNDFDGNGKPETILTYFVKGKEIPFANYAELTKQLPGLKKRYIYARDLARATPAELFGQEAWDTAQVFTAEQLRSVVYVQRADGTFAAEALPAQLQRSTINAIAPLAASDTLTHYLLGGNFHGANIEMGWYDAGRLSVLTFDRAGGMQVSAVPDQRPGEIRNIAPLRVGDRELYLLGTNNDSLQLLQPSNVPKRITAGTDAL